MAHEVQSHFETVTPACQLYRRMYGTVSHCVKTSGGRVS